MKSVRQEDTDVRVSEKITASSCEVHILYNKEPVQLQGLT